MKAKGIDAFIIPEKARRPLLVRMSFGYVSNASMYAGLKLLSMSKLTLLFWTQPMFVGVMGYFALGERFTKFDAAGLLIVFFGVVLISNPFQEE